MSSAPPSKYRMTLERAQEILLQPSPMVCHLCSVREGVLCIVSHIVCEHCDYCAIQGDCRGNPDAEAVPWKENIYEERELAEKKWEEERKA